MKQISYFSVFTVLLFSASGISAQNAGQGGDISSIMTKIQHQLNSQPRIVNNHERLDPTGFNFFPSCATHEGEADIPDNGVDFTDGGCAVGPANLSLNIQLDQCVSGRCNGYTWFGDPRHDFDWYKLELATTQTVYWTCFASFDPVVYIIQGPCATASLVGYVGGFAGIPLTYSAVLAPGTYYLVISPYSVGHQVNTDGDYLAKVTTAPPSPPATWCAGSVPTLGEWGLILLALGLISVASFFILKKRTTFSV
ncbi:MAG: IPTL-CTERM sorting domain-containing protein [Bacteroidota bacterium]